MKKTSIKVNYIFTSAYQIINILVPLVTMPYLSRRLGADGLGEYSFSYSVAYYFTLFIKLGLNNYGNREIAYCRNDIKTLSRTFWEIYTFQLFSGVVCYGIYLLYSIFFAPQKVLSLIMSLLILSSIIDVTWCVYGLEKFKMASIRDALIKILTTVCIFIFVKDVNDVSKYAFIFCSGLVLGNLAIVPVIRKELSFSRITINGVVKHIKPNLVLFVPVIATSIYRIMDKIMLGILSTDNELGYYHGTENIIRVPMAFVTALGTVMMPRISYMMSNNEPGRKTDIIFKKSIVFVMFISSSICFGIMTVSKEFVPIFYGKGFEKCVYLFYIILPGAIFEAFADVIRTQYLIPRKKDVIYICSLFCGAMVNVLLNIFLIPKFASIGAAIGTVAAYVMVCIIQATCVFKEADIGINLINSLPFIFAGIVMFAAFHNYAPPMQSAFAILFVKIIISGLLYMAVLGGMIIAKKVLVRDKT